MPTAKLKTKKTAAMSAAEVVASATTSRTGRAKFIN